MLGLPSMEHTFKIAVKGEMSQRTFEGEFVYKRLTLGDRLEARKWFKKKIEGVDIKDEANYEMVGMYGMLSTLRYGIHSGPEWWVNSDKGLNLHDANVVTSIFAEISKFEDKWNESLQKEAEADKPVAE